MCRADQRENQYAEQAKMLGAIGSISPGNLADSWCLPCPDNSVSYNGPSVQFKLAPEGFITHISEPELSSNRFSD